MILVDSLTIHREEHRVVHLDAVRSTAIRVLLAQNSELAAICRVIAITAYAIKGKNSLSPLVCLDNLFGQDDSD